jgi:hypothetical protein
VQEPARQETASLVTIPSGRPAARIEHPRPSRAQFVVPPRLVRVLQPRPEDGPHARQERLGLDQPDGYVNRQETSV